MFKSCTAFDLVPFKIPNTYFVDPQVRFSFHDGVYGTICEPDQLIHLLDIQSRGHLQQQQQQQQGEEKGEEGEQQQEQQQQEPQIKQQNDQAKTNGSDKKTSNSSVIPAIPFYIDLIILFIF